MKPKRIIAQRYLILFVICLLTSLITSASPYDFESDGVFYSINPDGTTVSVSYKSEGYNSYSGDVSIPNKVICPYKRLPQFSYSDYGGWGYSSPVIELNSSNILSNKIVLYTTSDGNHLTLTSPPFDCSAGQVIEMNVKWCVEQWQSNSFDINKIALTATILDDNAQSVDSVTMKFNQVSGINDVYLSITVPKDIESAKLRFASWNADSISHGAIRNIEISPMIDNKSYDVTSIGDFAFKGCVDLYNVTIPNSIISIGKQAFCNCSRLGSIYCYATYPPVMESRECFNTYNSTSLYVFNTSFNAYNSTYWWNQFNKIYAIDANGNILATEIILNETNKILSVNETFKLTATITPDIASNKTVSWTSSNNAVATVDSEGLVTALAAGTARITATTTDGSNLSASCNVSITQLATSISLNETDATMYTGNTLQLTATVSPSTTSNPYVTWSSGNTSVATVSSTGLVTAKSTGNAIITATTSDGSNLSASCSITVKRLATSISLNKSSATLYLNQTVQLTATVSPSNATDKSVVWSSSDNSIATVTSTGLVTAIAPGNATIKATTADGSNLSATCVITVKAYVTSLTIEPSEMTILEGDTIILTPTILPTYATNQNLTWSSSNTSVASVNNGEVIARSGGETTITARTADGSNLNANCKVTVVPNFVISAPDLSHLRGSLNNKFDLTIDLLNRYEITGIQFDLLLPTDVTIAKDSDGEFNIWVDETRKSRNHTATASLISGNTYRILVSSATANSLKGHSGTVLHIMIEIPISHVSGNKQVKYANIILSEPDETRHTLPTMYSTISYYYKEGDANADVNVDVADYVITGNYILQNGPENFWYDAANVDHNSTIDVNDLTGITNIALGRREGGILQIPAMQAPENNQDIELTANPLIIQAGQTKTMNLSLKGLRSFAGFQTDVQLPKGIKLTDASLADENSDLSIATAELPGGIIRLLASSFSLKDLAVNDASFLKLTLTADDSFSGNDFITLDGIKFSERDMTLQTIDSFAIPVGNDMSNLEQVYSVIRIYTDGMNVIIDSPESGTAQIVTIAGITQDREVHPGHNVIPMDNSGIYIVTLNGSTAKLYLK